MLSDEGSYLIDLVISRDQNVYPMVRPGKGLDDVIGVIDSGEGRTMEEGGAR